MAPDALSDLIATLGAIDHDEIDWDVVRSATYLIHQHYRYVYPSPITKLRQRLIVVPPDRHDGQCLVTHKLRVSGCDVELERSHDTFDNVVLDVSLERVEQAVDFTSWIVVERAADAAGDVLLPDPRLERPSRLTRPDDALRAVADELRASGAEAEALADLACARVHAHLAYRWGVTSVSTTAAEAWAGGVGVCQDYAHCLLALLRECGVAARYVSGHLLGEGGTHAWVEALLPHAAEPRGGALRALALDPTHDRRCGLRYVTVAIGRDYHDVAPVSGTYEGDCPGELSTYKRAAVTSVERRRRRR